MPAPSSACARQSCPEVFETVPIIAFLGSPADPVPPCGTINLYHAVTTIRIAITLWGWCYEPRSGFVQCFRGLGRRFCPAPCDS